ncbi:MAG: hypothetical protein COA47_08755 [Robiginitomaculum sp.]|nr:MAG: hypothetical protein COA47_08755 [Robiginitomaculum sp.]
MTRTLQWPKTIARKAVVNFEPYSARGGMSGALHLDANESPWAPPPVTNTEDFNRYPEQQPAALRTRLADLYGVRPDQIMIGRGADEAIEILLRTFCEATKDSILVCPPTFGYYRACAELQGAGIIEVPLQDKYTYDLEKVSQAIRSVGPSLKIVFLCTPNNPTGNCIQPSTIEKLCADFPETLIVVDEAYQEFSDQNSFATQIERFTNLIVLRTLSKAYALAGARLGVAIADPRIVQLMCKVLPPYPIARPVENAVMAALTPAAMSIFDARMDLWKSEVKRMAEALLRSPFVESIAPSQANFLLLKIKDSSSLLRELGRRQIKIRDMSKILPNHLRISIGTPQENDIALAAFGVANCEQIPGRIGEAHRKTAETDIAVRVDLDDASNTQIQTGIGFYDHMLEALAKHGKFGLVLTCRGDLHVDAHHTIEDCALVLGTALKTALGDKAGIGRFGFTLPMDESQARVAVDLSGRAAMTFSGQFPTDQVGDFPAEMCPHFFESLSQTLGAAIQIEVDGDNTHHMIEACFKGLAKCLSMAFERDQSGAIPSTKGSL